MAYATPEQLAARFDARVIGDLLSDQDRRVQQSEFAGNAVIIEALNDASGQIRSAALVANRYKEADLDALDSSSDPFLVRLTCGLAMGFLFARRHPDKPLPPEFQRCEDWLAALRLGEHIFNVEANADAGNPQVATLSLETRRELNLLGDKPRFFPIRSRYGVS